MRLRQTSLNSRTSLCRRVGIHLPQKTGGLFNDSMDKYPQTDWSDNLITQQMSPDFTPSPMKDVTDFLFPGTVDCEEVHKVDILQDLMLLPHTQSDVMADNIDFCEVFTDIENLITLDSTYLTQLPIPDDISTIDTTSLLITAQNTAPPPEVEHEIITTTPDHSYSTSRRPAATKRRFSELTNLDDEADEGTALVAVPVEVVKRTKYLERRMKNNIASKRSRETRKTKFLEMDDEATKLEQSNEDLRKRIELLESLTKRMKEALVAKLSAAS